MIKRNSLFISGILMLFLIAFTSCGSKGQLVNINGDYSMVIPNHLQNTKDLNDQASLQYQDPAKELYVIVIDESKDEFIQTFKEDSTYDEGKSVVTNYREVQMMSMADKIEIDGTPETRKATINGLSAEIVDFTGHSEGIPEKIYYKFAFIEGTKNVYMVMTWTLASDKEKNSEEMDAMLNSFKLQEAAKK